MSRLRSALAVPTRRFSPSAAAIVWLILGTTLIRFIFAACTGLGVDESYMVTAGRVLTLGYFDHPPASWWLSWAAAHAFGTEAPVAVRTPFILLFALSQLCLARITGEVADRRAAFWAVVALNVSPVFGVTTGTWVLPDGPLDAALLGAALCLLRALSRDRVSFAAWCGAGICAGLAMFSKYSAVLSIGGAFLFLLVSPTHRHWLRRPQPYIAIVLALAVFSPVLIWNAEHHWASLAFQGDRARGLRFHPLAPFATLGGEALFVLPWIWAGMMLVLADAARAGRPWQDRLLACLAAPPILVFALISLWSAQRVLFHWAAPGYLMLFPLLGKAIARHDSQRWIHRVAFGSAALVLLAVAVICCQIQFDLLGGSLHSIMRRDPTMEGLDWLSVRRQLRQRGLLLDGTVAAALNWRDAGKFGHALGPGVTMLCLDRDARQFQFANPDARFAGRNVLILSLDPPDRARERAAPWFHAVQPQGDVSIDILQRRLQTVTVLQGVDLRMPGTAMPYGATTRP